MGLALDKVHEYKRIKDSGQAVLLRTNPYVRLSKGNDSDPEHMRVFIQNGEFYTESGALLPPERRPKWLAEEIAKLSPKTKQEVGLTVSDGNTLQHARVERGRSIQGR